MMNFDDYNLILDQLNIKFKKWNKVRKNRSIKILMKDIEKWEDEIPKIWNIKETKKMIKHQLLVWNVCYQQKIILE